MQGRQCGSVDVADRLLDHGIDAEPQILRVRRVSRERVVQAHRARRVPYAVVQGDDVLRVGEIQVCKSHESRGHEGMDRGRGRGDTWTERAGEYGKEREKPRLAGGFPGMHGRFSVSGEHGSHAIQSLPPSHEAGVMFDDIGLMLRDGPLNRALAQHPEYAFAAHRARLERGSSPREADRPTDPIPMEPGARVTGASENASGSPAEAGGYCVADLVVDVRHERVTRDGREIPLAKLSFDLLAILIRNAPHLVSVELLMQEVWSGLVVGPETVSQRVKLIRDALGDDSKQPRYIAGVRGRGYRLIAPVEPQRAAAPRGSEGLEPAAVAASSASGTASAVEAERPRRRALRVFGIAAGAALGLVLGYLAWDRGGRAIPQKSGTPNSTSVVVTLPTIAVLPFADMSPEKDQEYFADGLSEELSDHLSRLPGLRVIGRSSAFSFKGRNEDLRTIGKALGVRHLLEGSVRKAGDQLRITAQLVDANGTRVWSNTYDQKLGDIFAIQDEVAKGVAAALSVTLTAGEIEVARGGTRNAEAYDAYLAGKALLTSGLPEDMRRGIGLLERAVALDPQFALGWSELAQTYAGAGPLPERGGTDWNVRTMQATTRALEIAPDLPSVLTAVAVIAMQQKQWAEAERRLQRARALAVGRENVWEKSGWFLVTVGRPLESTEYFRRAGRAEPLLSFYPTATAAAYEMSGKLDEAAAELARAGPLFGERAFYELNRLTQAMARRDRAEIEKIIATYAAYDALGRALRSHDSHAALVEVRRLAEDPAHPKNVTWRSLFAYWAAYLDDPQLALELMHDMPADPSFAFVLWRPVVKDMRRLPGFKNLVRDLGLVDYWRASGNWGEFCRPLGKDDFECT